MYVYIYIPIAPFIRQDSCRYPSVGSLGHPTEMYSSAPSFPFGGSPEAQKHLTRKLIVGPAVDDAPMAEGGSNKKASKRAIEAEVINLF